MSIERVEILIGQSARDLLCERDFLAAWKILFARCTHATGFQSTTYVLAWYETYKTSYQPVIVWSRFGTGELCGLWLLAYDFVRHELVHAGAHQAEYHVWLALPGSCVDFLGNAWAALRQQLAFKALRFKYLPAAFLTDALRAAPGIQDCMAVRLLARPLAKLDASEINASFAKKSNKSRFNRIKKLGALEFRRLTELEEFEQVFEDLILFYDFRQGAVNRTRPFREDPFKRTFCRALFCAAKDETHLTVTSIAGRTVAAHWGMLDGKTLHLGMIAYSPLLAEYSPGKLHIMQLSNHLLKEGTEILDLTPGGDSWKERFANVHDQVAEVVMYRSPVSRTRAATLESLMEWAKRGATMVGVTPSDIRTMIAVSRRVGPSAALRKASRWVYTQPEFRVYRGDRDFAARFGPNAQVAKNSLADLLCFEPGETWQSRDAFLSSALARLERGEFVYTVCIDGRLAHYGWMVCNQTESFATEVQQSIVLPQNSVALYDYYTHPNFRGRGFYRATISHMLHAAFADPTARYAYISVLADNLSSRRAIQSLGFAYQGSLYWRSRFGSESKWADPVFASKEAPDA